MPESPIGSIIAYGGARPTRAWEEQEGWLHCDGRLLDRDEVVNGTQAYRALWQTIWYAWGGDGDAKFNLPDLQGFFLRGVDASHEPPRPDAQVPSPVDPDRDQRIRPRPGGNAGANVGSVQLSATAMPRGTPFTTYPGGEHDHSMNFELYASRDVGDEINTVAHPSLRADRNEWPKTVVAGTHAHKIEGGDKETRPVNAYVYWIIRYR